MIIANNFNNVRHFVSILFFAKIGCCYVVFTRSTFVWPWLWEVAHLLDLDVAESERPLFAEVFSGSAVLPGEGWVGGASWNTHKDEDQICRFHR